MIDSSSSSVESSFRNLDEVFLQTQTRIWLGEVLNSRLDGDLPISDLLQDGEILFEVSKILWDLLMKKCMEFRHLKHRQRPFGSKRSNGRYRPYSNVDSFLKVCKILGLSGIDLFSPSDVVEKRDTRKVCVCIRMLSKKARSKLLGVPDFDVVIYSVPMPTDMVGVIRRSLESSQCTSSSSSSYTSPKDLPEPKQKKLYTTNNRDYSSSEESDEAESRYMGETGNFNSNHENSPEAHSTSERKLSSGRVQRHSFRNGAAGASNDCSVGDSSCISVGENSYISNYLAFSDLMVHATNGSSPIIHDGERNMFDFFLNLDPQSMSSQNGPHRKFTDDEDLEVSSTTSMTSVLGRMLSLDFDDQFYEDELSSTSLYSSELMEREAEKLYKDSSILSEQSNVEIFGSHPRSLLCVSQESPPRMESKELSASAAKCSDKCATSGLKFPEAESCLPQMSHPENIIFLNQKSILCKDMGNTTGGITTFGSETGICINLKSAQDRLHLSAIDTKGTIEEYPHNHLQSSPNLMNGAEEDTHLSNKLQDGNCSGQDKRVNGHHVSDVKVETSSQAPPEKNGRRPQLLKTMVKGTVVATVLFLLLHIRKNKGNDTEETILNAQPSKYNKSKSSSTKQQTGRGRYPSGKIKF